MAAFGGLSGSYFRTLKTAAFKRRSEVIITNPNNCDVRQSYKIEPKLGKWVSQQRTKYSKDKLEAIKISRLTDLGFIWKIK